MANLLNPYLSHEVLGIAPTQNLIENMNIEAISIAGQNYIYIPRTISQRKDTIFGEDVLSSFDSYAEIPMYLSDFSGESGESEMISKFGFEIRNTASFIMSRKQYTDIVMPIVPVDRDPKLKWRPNEGDLVYAPISKTLHEIMFIEDEFPGYYQLNKKYVWTLRCEMIRLNNEKFNTGYTAIDNMFNQNIDRLNYRFLLEDTTGTFLCEDGGNIINEDFVLDNSPDDLVSGADNDSIKQEFMDIMNFSADNPFAERF